MAVCSALIFEICHGVSMLILLELEIRLRPYENTVVTILFERQVS